MTASGRALGSNCPCPSRLARPIRHRPPVPRGRPSGPVAPDVDINEALAPLRSYKLSASDAANLKTSIRHSYRNRFSRARAHESKIKDPAARKLAHWYRLRSGDYSAGVLEIVRFQKENPHWPDHKLLRQRTEESLLIKGASPAMIQSLLQGIRAQDRRRNRRTGRRLYCDRRRGNRQAAGEAGLAVLQVQQVD